MDRQGIKWSKPNCKVLAQENKGPARRFPASLTPPGFRSVPAALLHNPIPNVFVNPFHTSDFSCHILAITGTKSNEYHKLVTRINTLPVTCPSDKTRYRIAMGVNVIECPYVASNQVRDLLLSDKPLVMRRLTPNLHFAFCLPTPPAPYGIHNPVIS
jgi:hypothetical protein